MITVESIQEKLEEAGLSNYFTLQGLEGLNRFIKRMLEINKEVNLTHFEADNEVLDFHVLDSAQSLPLLGSWLGKPGASWMDMGTGGGFPGAVLAAAFPQLDLLFMDSTNKKMVAVESCLEAAGWSFKTVSARAEDLGRDPRYRESLDGITARAVADLPVLLEYAIPLLKTGGYLVNWMTESQVQFVDKSEKALDELKAKIVKKSDYSLLSGTQKRYLVVVEKMGKTSSHYPRTPGTPSKKPL
jgi:16S rRNA (guanine527-N7)-methyltransferase